MSTKSPTYFPQLDGLRTIAVLMVMMAHWLPYEWLSIWGFGPLGVYLFFVLSGFLITRILLHSKSRIDLKENSIGSQLKTFYMRRVLRIFPMYYLLIGITYLFTPSTRPGLWWNLTYTSNFYLIEKGDWAGPMSHYWSLAVEEQFYLIWPLLLFLVPRTRIKHVLWGSILFGIGSRWVMQLMGASYLSVYILTPACWDLFAVGGLLAYMQLYEGPRLQQWLKQGPIFGLSLILCFFTLTGHLYLPESLGFMHQLFPKFFFAFFVFWLLGKASIGFQGGVGKFLSHPWMVYLGKISYSLYLFHNFMDGFFLGVKYPESPLLRFFMYLAGAIIVSSLAYYLVEKPFQRLKKYFPYKEVKTTVATDK
ncbi:MAG: acyltransferase [Bacteroidota bacterium]